MENKLDKLAEFKHLLAKYQPSAISRQILTQTNLVLMVAPSATGRNTIIQELLKSGEYHFVVSDTTRHPRLNDGVLERSGCEYWFRDEKDVLADVNGGNYLEAAIIHGQQVSGISVRELVRARDEAKIAITDIEITGVHNIVAAKPDVKAIFVLPPNFDSWMQRMDGRGELSAAEKRRRLMSAVDEFNAALKQRYFRYIVNDTLDHAVEQIHAIANGKLDQRIETTGRELALKLRDQTSSWLKQI